VAITLPDGPALRHYAVRFSNYIAVTGLFFGTALIACYIPGLRAMRTDPAVALRAE